MVDQDQAAGVTFGLGQLVIVKPETPPADADLPKEAQRPPVRTRFGSALELLAYELGPVERQPGEELEIRLYWRARRRVTAGHRLVLNWQDEHGDIWHTSQVSLTGVEWAQGPWARGEFIRGVVRLEVPEQALQGAHSLHLLVFDSERETFLWLRRGWLVWSGRDLELGRIIVR
jgi:hypothetical protein